MAKAPPIQKDVQFEGSSLDDLRTFPAEMRQEAGYQLDRVQRGLDPTDWKPMAGAGSGVKEIRLRDAEGWYRVMYVAKFENHVYVLHAFSKQTRKTAKTDLDLAKTRYSDLMRKMRKKP